MLDNEKLYHQIDAYLRGDLSPSDKVEFENQIQKDLLLQHELELQQAIIEGIKDSRKLALKASLSGLNVSLWSLAVAEFAKIAASLVIGASILAGGYYWYQQQSDYKETITVNTGDQTLPTNDKSIGKINLEEPIAFGSNDKSVTSEGIAAEKTNELSSERSVSASNANDNSIAKDKRDNKKKSRASYTEKVDATEAQKSAANVTGMDEIVDIPDVKIDIPVDEPAVTKSGVDNLPSGKVSNTFKTESVRPEVVYKKHNKDKFYYQYFSNKLTLYGNFDEIVYELLELNTNDGKKLYIYFNNKFYHINNSQVDMAPLKEIVDSALVKELNYLRKRKLD